MGFIEVDSGGEENDALMTRILFWRKVAGVRETEGGWKVKK